MNEKKKKKLTLKRLEERIDALERTAEYYGWVLR